MHLSNRGTPWCIGHVIATRAIINRRFSNVLSAISESVLSVGLYFANIAFYYRFEKGEEREGEKANRDRVTRRKRLSNRKIVSCDFLCSASKEVEEEEQKIGGILRVG